MPPHPPARIRLLLPRAGAEIRDALAATHGSIIADGIYVETQLEYSGS